MVERWRQQFESQQWFFYRKIIGTGIDLEGMIHPNFRGRISSQSWKTDPPGHQGLIFDMGKHDRFAVDPGTMRNGEWSCV